MGGLHCNWVTRADGGQLRQTSSGFKWGLTLIPDRTRIQAPDGGLSVSAFPFSAQGTHRATTTRDGFSGVGAALLGNTFFRFQIRWGTGEMGLFIPGLRDFLYGLEPRKARTRGQAALTTPSGGGAGLVRGDFLNRRGQTGSSTAPRGTRRSTGVEQALWRDFLVRRGRRIRQRFFRRHLGTRELPPQVGTPGRGWRQLAAFARRLCCTGHQAEGPPGKLILGDFRGGAINR